VSLQRTQRQTQRQTQLRRIPNALHDPSSQSPFGPSPALSDPLELSFHEWNANNRRTDERDYDEIVRDPSYWLLSSSLLPVPHKIPVTTYFGQNVITTIDERD
jgi:hypothetical protein